MTGLLTDLMRERADDLAAPDLDLAGITREGDRRVRTRRAMLAAGLAAAAAVAAVAVPSFVTGDDPAQRDLVADGTAADPQQLAWITGSTLHRPGQPDVDLGAEVRAWVWVGDDIAFTDPGGRVQLWTGGDLDVLGRTAAVAPDQGELVSDGTQVAWVDAERGFTVLDVATGEQTSTEAQAGPDAPAEVNALDGGNLYGTDARGTVDWFVGGVVEIFPDLGSVVDAESDSLVREVEGRRLAVFDRERVELATGDFATLSPDGALVALENDDVGRVYDAATGDALPFDHGHEWAIGYEWLDTTTLAVMAFDGLDEDAAQTGWLLTCDGRTGACDGPGTELPVGIGDFQLPIGIHFTQ